MNSLTSFKTSQSTFLLFMSVRLFLNNYYFLSSGDYKWENYTYYAMSE